MNVLITGADGYIGWPLAISLAKNRKNIRLICVDNLSRRDWLKEVSAKSAIPISSFNDKKKFLKSFNTKNDFFNFDLNNFNKLDKLVKKYKFDFIINLAAQPSAPYSFMNIEKCNFTQNNNNQILRNIIWSIKGNNLQLKTKLLHTTTTGVYGAPNITIPEGYLKMNNENYPFGFMAGSWYHMSKCNDINNLYLANNNFGINSYDFRTAITVGLDYDGFETSKKNSIHNTRFDYDYYFGVVLNRFIAMALTKSKITLYGKGLQEKPFISLKDTVKSIVNLTLNPPKKGGVYNQLTNIVSIKKIAQIISSNNLFKKLNVVHIKNPRVENETHKMKMSNKNFVKILGSKGESLKNTIDSTIKILDKLDAKIDKKKFLQKN